MGTCGRLDGKKTLVTGSGTGIGREIALEFARQGADVVLHYAHAEELAASAVDEIRAIGRKAEVFKADFTNLDDVLLLANRAIDFLGRIDCLVNNAGITFNRPFLRVTPQQYEQMYNVNVRAPYFLLQAMTANMQQHGGGCVCNIASIHGLVGAPEHSVYAGTKGAVIAQTRALAVELAHKGIRINAIAPGCVPVENYYKVVPNYSSERNEEWAKNAIPVGHAGTPLDIARLAVFLCSDDADFIVGQTIVADGGTVSLMSLISDFRNEATTCFGKGYLPDL